MYIVQAIIERLKNGQEEYEPGIQESYSWSQHWHWTVALPHQGRDVYGLTLMSAELANSKRSVRSMSK